MDPQTAVTTTSALSNPSVFASMMALAFGLMKLLEITLTALFKKYKLTKPQKIEVQLDPELAQRIMEMDEKLNSMSNVMGRTDNDGTPMVYSSRSGVDAVREIAIIMRNTSQTLERLAHMLERLEQKFVDHDRTDAATFANMNGQMERMMRSFDEHDKRVMESLNVQIDIRRIAEENRRKLEKLETQE
jgi:hypothetical protein